MKLMRPRLELQAQLPAEEFTDVSLAIVGLGILIVIAPSSVPGLTPPNSDVLGSAGHANQL
jgi:hypothetical protein